MRDAAAAPLVGSKRQSSLPVAASSANTCSLGVVAYSTPSITTGLACISEPLNSSCVSYVHATLRRATLAGEIWPSVVKCVLSVLPPYTGQSTVRGCAPASAGTRKGAINAVRPTARTRGVCVTGMRGVNGEGCARIYRYR